MSIELPDFIFRHTNSATDIATEKQHYTKVEEVVLGKGGVYVFLEGAEYPQIGMVTPEMLASMNIVKRLFIQMFKLANKIFFWPTIVLVALMPWKKKLKVIDNVVEMFTEVSYKAMQSYILNEEYQTQFSKEMEWFIFFLLKRLDVPIPRATKCAEVISTVIQADTAYRFRVMDMFQGIRKEKLIENPRKEISRAFDMLMSRERDRDVRRRFLWIGYVIQMLLLNRKFKNIFVEAVKKTSINSLKFDEANMYWALLYKDYNTLGLGDFGKKEMLGDASIPPLETA